MKGSKRQRKKITKGTRRTRRRRKVFKLNQWLDTSLLCFRLRKLLDDDIYSFHLRAGKHSKVLEKLAEKIKSINNLIIVRPQSTIDFQIGITRSCQEASFSGEINN